MNIISAILIGSFIGVFFGFPLMVLIVEKIKRNVCEEQQE